MRNRIAAVVVLIATLSACATESASTQTSEPGCSSAEKGSLTVFSASSMVNVFNDVKAKYLASHPCTTDVIFSYGSSGTLAAQIVNGAPADIFVAASSAAMATVQNANPLKVAPSTFAKNIAEIMMYSKSQFVGTIGTVQDLLDARSPSIKVGLCVTSAPCGSLADSVLVNARTAYSATNITRANIADSEAPSVEDLVMKIQLGEFDAGIVYHSDCQVAVSSAKAACISIPPSINSTTSYLVGQLNSTKRSSDFVAYLNSNGFQQVLQEKYGFLAP
jgi:molybdate transport system substrate-binding protein